jgi:O-antigen ligase
MARDRPVWGYGSGAFAERYKARENPRSTTAAMVSHTTPLTIAAEQGVIGVAAYLVLLWTAFALLFSGLRGALRTAAPRVEAVARAALAAAFAGLVLHTLVYAAFLEDPLAWTILAASAGLAVALWRRTDEPEAAVTPDQPPAAAPAAPVR